MKYIYFITLLILASATLGLAQFEGLSELSQDCRTALTGLLGNKDINACFPFSSVVGLVSSGGPPNQDSLKNATDAICAAPKCSDSLVSQTSSTVQNGCKADIQNNNNIAQLAYAVLTFYSPTRDSLCFKNSTGGYCFIESWTSIQQIIQSAPKNQSPVLTFANAPTSTVCTPCNKAIANSYSNFLSQNTNAVSALPNVTSSDVGTAKNALTGKCGQKFLDGSVGDSTENPSTFQSQTTGKQSDATSLVANYMSFVILVGSILAML